MKDDSPQPVDALAIVLLVVLCIVGFLLYAFDWTWFSNTKLTHYRLVCLEELKDGECPGGWWTRVPPVDYLVLPDQQIVVRQTVGQAPHRLSNCAVVDKQNWNCQEGSQADGLLVGFTDGLYWTGQETGDRSGVIEAKQASDRTVSRWRWLLDAK